MSHPRTAVLMAIVVLDLRLQAGAAEAGARKDVTFEVFASLGVSSSVFVLGSLPELGGGDLTKAIRLVDNGESMWKVTVRLPADTSYWYQFYERDNATLCMETNGTPLEDPVQVEAEGSGPPVCSKTFFTYSESPQPVLHWRQGTGRFLTIPMEVAGPGRREGETLWRAGGAGSLKNEVEFYRTDAEGGSRDPASGSYRTSLDVGIFQDGQLFYYVPPQQVSTHRLDHEATSPPIIQSAVLGELRRYRVLLPRGYDEQLEKRYPVVYLHDGEWWSYDALGALAQSGSAREVIVVGVDNMSDSQRLRDLLTPGDVLDLDGVHYDGGADRYVKFIIEELKPLIDSRYRTLPDAQNTAAAGFSLGGLIAFYMGWDYPETFHLIGAQAGSFWLPVFTNRVFGEPKHDLRIYLDTGNIADNYIENLNLRDNLVSKSPEPYVIEKDLRLIVGCGQTHSVADVTTRWPSMFSFLFPVEEDPARLQFTVPPSPLADFAFDGRCFSPATPGCLSASLSKTPEGTSFISYGWDFGDGEQASGEDACHVFAESGHYAVTLTVTNDRGLKSQVEKTICVTCGAGGPLSPWSFGEIGTPPFAGSARFQGEGEGRFLHLCTSGAGLGGTSDMVHFVHRELEGDVILTAHVPELSSPAGKSEVGLMLRSGLDAKAAFAAMVFSEPEESDSRLFFRMTNGGSLRPPRRGPSHQAVQGWLGIERKGNEFFGLVSRDGGTTWERVSETPVVLDLPPKLFGGLFVASGESEESSAVVPLRVLALEVKGGGTALRPRFHRGDPNSSGEIDISDSIRILGFLFLGDTAPTCRESADANNDRTIDISDGVFLLSWLFTGGPAPAAPGPTGAPCGVDTDSPGSAGDLGCESYAVCQ